MNEFLAIKDLQIEYLADDTKVYAVNGVSLTLAKGECLGLVGETGAGKTTTALGIMGLLPKPQGKYTGGEIWFQNQNIIKLDNEAMRAIRGKRISMIFQDPMTSLNPVLPVGEQIAEVIRLHEKLSRIEASIKAGEMLELVGIPIDRYQEYPHQFSGGMKQRVIIAMALACNPELLLADEPTTALDVTIQAQVLDMMRSLKEKLGTSVVLITHDLGVVARFCDSVAVAYAGEIVERGSAEHIFDFPKHPYTLGLFGSLPRVGTSGRRLNPVKGLMPDPTNLPDGCRFKDRCPEATDKCGKSAPGDYEIEPGHIVKCFLVAGEVG